MSEFILDILDVGGMGGDNNVSGGVPIPRGPNNRQNQHLHYPDLGNMGLSIPDCHSPQQPQTPSNSFASSWDGSNVMINHIQLQDSSTTGGFSPATSHSPALWQTHSLDMDLDIKLEPLDDLLGVDDFLQHTYPSSMQTADSQLLDDVNLDDLLMPGETLDSHAMDQQPSSPMTMITVHPDDVINFKGHNNNNNYRSSSSSLFNASTSPQPVKAESSSLYSLLASSFPPQGQTWRDPLLTSSSLPAHQANSPLTSIEEYPTINQQQLHGSHSSFHQNQQNFSGSHSNTGSTSALQELLLRSPSTTLSSTPISPCPLSPTPLSPHRHTSSPQMSQSPQQHESFLGQSVPRHSSLSAANPQLSARLSSSAPSHNFFEQQKWMRREPRQHLLSTGSMAEELGGSASSLSTVGGIMSPGAHDLSIDEGIDSDDESDNEKYDSDSDNDSNISEDPGSLSGSMKKERFFWQYNVQAKGPKGQKVTIQHNQKDPYSLPQVMDPVFSPMCSLQGIKHSGKARRGDGNDLTPNPRKLVSIGRELEKLNKVINDMTPVSELPFNIRPKSRKEKNKLASRACRLKKKAQHEANKIKLYGLQHEHRSLMSTIDEARKALVHKIDFRQSGQSTGEGSGGGMGGMSGNMSVSPGGFYSQPTPGPSSPQGFDIDKALKNKKNAHIAGNTTLFVNKVIENTQSGNQTGGLEDLSLNFSNTKLATSPPTTTGMGGFTTM
ncbi:unnamed protein product [Meganyctiphanes norvegica]|uniref:BZIP domain-containing protein n=1 Tax=Meganyctiphanes norvegica TaxID=48144 RepID=A0AAV2Q220_MEGNR